MFEGDLARYLLVGLSGLKVIDVVLRQCPPRVINTILDFPCGGGRVGRFLAARFPETRITACDLDTGGVDFCSQVLGMEPAYSQVDFDKVCLKDTYDLIWCGSLVTHLDAKPILRLLRLFELHLNDNGVMVFTTHGDYVAHRMSGGDDYGIGRAASKKAVEAYRACGFAFMPYLEQNDASEYGTSITSADWVRSHCSTMTSLKEVYFQPRGWDNHQDVYGFVKVAK